MISISSLSHSSSFICQTTCINCSRVVNKRIKEIEKETGQQIRPDQISNISTKHDGPCYRNSNLHPAVAEEEQAAMAARHLLCEGETDIYAGDNLAIFGYDISTDGDTRGAARFIRIQNQIIGEAADNVADTSPDRGHVIKCNNNAMHSLAKNDKSFSGVNLLNTSRIKSINSDLAAVVQDYEEEGVGEAGPRAKCLKQIDAIPSHHCGDHSLCTCEKYCTYLKVKKEHPDWDDDQIEAMAAKISTRAFAGKYMGLSPAGIASVRDKIRDRFNEKTIDKIAKGGCTNLSESFWNMLIKFSEGKRLCLDLTDLWEVMCKLTFCRVGEGNVKKTHDYISDRLGLPVTSQETRYLTRAAKARKSDKKRFQTADNKKARKLRKLTNDLRTDKIDSRKAHKTDKVPVSESAKSSVSQLRKVPCCSSCGLPGHTRKICKMPLPGKRKVEDLLDFDLDLLNMFDDNDNKSSKRKSKR